MVHSPAVDGNGYVVVIAEEGSVGDIAHMAAYSWLWLGIDAKKNHMTLLRYFVLRTQELFVHRSSPLLACDEKARPHYEWQCRAHSGI